jgi:hypothetical protein
MDVEHEITVVGGEEQMLPAAPGPCEPPTLQSIQRRIEGLEGGDVCGSCLLDRIGTEPLVEQSPVRLHLW